MEERIADNKAFDILKKRLINHLCRKCIFCVNRHYKHEKRSERVNAPYCLVYDFDCDDMKINDNWVNCKSFVNRKAHPDLSTKDNLEIGKVARELRKEEDNEKFKKNQLKFNTLLVATAIILSIVGLSDFIFKLFLTLFEKKLYNFSIFIGFIYIVGIIILVWLFLKILKK